MNAATVVALRRRMVAHMFDDYDFDSFAAPDVDSVGKSFTKAETQVMTKIVVAVSEMLGDSRVPTYRVAPHVMGTMIEAGKVLPHLALQPGEPMTESGCLFFDVPTTYGHLETLLPSELWKARDRVERVDCHGFIWVDFGNMVVVSLLVRYPDTDDADYPVPGPLLTMQRGEQIDESALGDAAAWARCIVALWRFMNQKLLTTSVDPIPRGMRRGAARKAEDLPEVRTIELRSSRPADVQRGLELGRDWSHRWIVRGHWRQQWHPTTDEHLLTWIDPHIKGPQDKPLIIRPTLYDVRR